MLTRIIKPYLLFLIMLCGVCSLYAAESLYKTGKNIIINGSFDYDRNQDGVPDNWIRSIQMPGAKAEIKLEKEGKGNCIKINFFKRQFMLQARVYQKLTVIPGKVYELTYRYKSGSSSELKADVLMTGTGPLYRSVMQEPTGKWVKKRLIFLIPKWMKGTAAIYVQNRSTIPIWYDDFSFRETDIPPDKIKEYQVGILAQPISSEDQLIMPGASDKNVKFLISINASGKIKKSLYYVARLLTPNGKEISCQSNGNKINIPVKSIPDGTSILSVLLFDRNKLLVDSSKLAIEKIPATAMKMNMKLSHAAVFKDNYGKAFFPIGMYGININPSKKILNELRNNGFNTIHSYSFEGKQKPGNSKRITRFLDLAQQYNLKVMAGLPRGIVEKNGRTKELVKFIKMLKPHPAVLFYYSDEMYNIRHTPVKLVKSAYEVIKKNDPSRKWIVYESPNKIIAPYIDGIMHGVSNVNTAKLIRLRLGSKKPVFTVFGQPDYKAGQAPSLQKMRYNIFMPVILGARGMFYWWFPTLQWNNKQKDILKERLYASSKIMAAIAPSIISDEKLPPWTKQIKSTGQVRYHCSISKDELYIICGAEQSSKGGSIKFKVPPGYCAELIFSPGKKLVAGKLCRLSLEPEEICIVKVIKEDELKK